MNDGILLFGCRACRDIPTKEDDGGVNGVVDGVKARGHVASASPCDADARTTRYDAGDFTDCAGSFDERPPFCDTTLGALLTGHAHEGSVCRPGSHGCRACVRDRGDG